MKTGCQPVAAQALPLACSAARKAWRRKGVGAGEAASSASQAAASMRPGSSWICSRSRGGRAGLGRGGVVGRAASVMRAMFAWPLEPQRLQFGIPREPV